MGDVNHEPTMEEILASIKKIIAEDGDTAVSESDARSRRKRPVIETTEPPLSEEIASEDAASDEVLELTDPVAPETGSDPIVSDEASKASEAAFAALTAITRSPATDGDSGEAHPLEGLVREMLRPMLKEWLDENLPPLVEEMVAREIARIAAGQE
ncbi:MAG: DUF2497 domain-containing protein [Pseudomonadota bacterium]